MPVLCAGDRQLQCRWKLRSSCCNCGLRATRLCSLGSIQSGTQSVGAVCCCQLPSAAIETTSCGHLLWSAHEREGSHGMQGRLAAVAFMLENQPLCDCRAAARLHAYSKDLWHTISTCRLYCAGCAVLCWLRCAALRCRLRCAVLCCAVLCCAVLAMLLEPCRSGSSGAVATMRTPSG
jgi:hypothetical protein